MEKEHMVIKLSTALSLRHSGIITPSYFSYYDEDGDLQALPTADSDRTFLAFAYTAGELMTILPGGLEIDQNTFVSTISGWVRLPIAERSYRYAHLLTEKGPGGSFITKYGYDHWSIALRTNDVGYPAYLVFIDESPAESLAAMVLALHMEKKLNSDLAIQWDDEDGTGFSPC